MAPKDFIAAVSAAAVASARATGVPASFTVVQAALESGWGAHAPGNNLFGIKADKSWTGPTTSKTTREFEAGKWVQVEARFRAYPDWQGSMDDHAAFFRTNKRYKACFSYKDGIGFARAAAAAGYATDPNYADLLVRLIQVHGLQSLDSMAGAVEEDTSAGAGSAQAAPAANSEGEQS